MGGARTTAGTLLRGDERAMVWSNKYMKSVAAFVFALVMCAQSSVDGNASWLVDTTEFHMSAHGQTACIDCHGDVADRDLHPDPSNVTKRRIEFFDPEQCVACHDDIPESLEEGVHGSKTVDDPDKYGLCLRCHKPHHQPRLGDNKMGTFDPDVPKRTQCGACHEARTELPEFSEEDRQCLKCHLSVDTGSEEGAGAITELCVHCHEQGEGEARQITGTRVALLEKDDYSATPHSGLSCITCHPDATRLDHKGQQPGECTSCHTRHHDEKTAHDAHLSVDCEACHLRGVKPVKKPGTDVVSWERERVLDEPLGIHDMVMYEDTDECRRCHVSGNRVGAASMVLPAKSVLCMPCHVATFSVGDATTIIALVVFVAGMVMLFAYWLSGSMPSGKESSTFGKLLGLAAAALRTIFSPKIGVILKAMLMDVLLQRRLYRRSPTRWLIHSLIFLPFVFRCVWGLIALLGSLWAPDSAGIWDMVNKNHPVTAFLFDFTGVLILMGIVLALIRGGMKTVEGRPSGLPEQDRIALSLIGGIVVVGFVLEGLRIALTGWPVDAGYAFVGYMLSMIVSWATGTYGVVWYLHAVLAGAFIAYVPFSRLSHIIMGPVVLAMGAASEHEHEEH